MTASLFDDAPRPKYRRPMMREIRNTRAHGGRAVSTFSGAGGGSLGLVAAGWQVPVAVEFVQEAAQTYRINFPGAFVIPQDIREIKAETIRMLAGGPIDLFEGSPPCSGFSTSGIRDAGWGRERAYSTGRRQRTDDLFDHWIRLVEELQPRAVLAENVAGMMEGRALEEHAQVVVSKLSEAGYRVAAHVLDAADFGVPQRRRRLIFLGYRKDLGMWPRLPGPTSERFTLRDALGDVDQREPAEIADREAASMRPYAVGRTWEAMHGLRPWEPDPEDPEGLPVKPYHAIFHGEWDKPCRTITAKAGDPSTASVVHPDECRKFTAAEMLSISGFPRDFVLTGTVKQRTERVGRAVPPPLYRVVGSKIADDLGFNDPTSRPKW